MNIQNIQLSQHQYFNLVKSYEKIIFSNHITLKEIAMIMDEIHCFWLDRRDILSFELQYLSLTKETIMLSGSLYLDLDNGEHYIFKMIGKEHVIPDPLLKMESFFRLPESLFDSNYIDVFKRAYRSVYSILSNYKNVFYILPVGNFVFINKQEQLNLFRDFCLSFINLILEEDFDDFDGFFSRYSTYEEIEKKISPFFRELLILTNSEDRKLSLRERIEKYVSTISIYEIFSMKSEAEKFIYVFQNYISQIVDILIISITMNFIPFIINPVTFNYLIIAIFMFDDKEILDIISKSIIIYIFYNTIPRDKIIELEFDELIAFSMKNDFLKIILEKMKEKEIKIHDLSAIGDIIEKEIIVLMKKNNFL